MAQRQDVPSPDPSLARVAGLVVVDKPLGWTSHDVASRMRRLAGTRKVGHAGTLDPAASGVLVIGVEKATKLLTYVTGTDKTYRASIRLGAATVTDDAQGEVTCTASPEQLAGVTDQQVMTVVGELSGEIQQVPSAVSAIKVGGKRSYARVRSGEDVQLAARPVTVSAFEVHEIRRVSGEPAFVDVEATVTCSSGTYIRALARDMGSALGVGGHLTALRRTRVGPFTLEHAYTLDELARQVASGGTVDTLEIARAARLLFPVRELGAEEATDLSHGRRISASPGTAPDGDRAESGDGPVTACFAPDGTLVALAQDRGAAARRYATSVLGITVGTRFAPGPGETPGAGASDGAGAADGPDVAEGDDAHGSPQRQDDKDIDTGTDA